MAGLITAGLRLVSVAETRGVRQFTESIRNLRVEMLGFEQVGSTIQAVGNALTSISRVSGGALASVAQSGVMLDNTMNKLAAVASPKLDKSVDQLTSSFLKLSSELPLSANQLGQVGVEAARAGIESGAAIEKIALASGKLAALADDLTEQKASKQLLTISNNFGVSAENMGNNVAMLADHLAALDAAGVATASQIAEASKRASAAGQIAQFQQGELLALTTAALNTGASSEVAGTAITRVLTAMTANTDKVAQSVGLSTEKLREMVLQGKGLDALTLFLTRLKYNADGTQRSTIEMSESIKAAGLAGARTFNVVANLANNLGKLKAATDLSANATGALDRKFAQLAQSAEQKMKTLAGSVENLSISFGLVLQPFIVAFVDVFNPLVNVLTQIPSGIKLMILATVAAVTVVTALGAAAALAVGGLTLLISTGVFLTRTYFSASELLKTFTKDLAGLRVAYKRVDLAQQGLLHSRTVNKMIADVAGLRAQLAATPASLLHTRAAIVAQIAATDKAIVAQQAMFVGSLKGNLSALLKNSPFGGFTDQFLQIEKATAAARASAIAYAQTIRTNLVSAFASFRAASITDLIVGMNKAFLAAPGKLAGGISGLFAGGATAQTGVIAGAIASAKGLLGGATGAALTSMAALLAKLAVVILAVVALAPELGGVLSAIGDVFAPIGKFIGDIARATGLVGEAGSIFDSALAIMRAALFPAILVLDGLILTLRGVGSVLGAVLDAVVVVFRPIGEAVARIRGGFSVIAQDVRDFASGILGAKDGVSAIDYLVSGLGSVVSYVLTPIANMWAFIMKIGAAVVGGLGFGVLEALVQHVFWTFAELAPLAEEFGLLFTEFKALGWSIVAPFFELWQILTGTTGEFDWLGVAVQVVAAGIRLILLPLKMIVKVTVMLLRAFVGLGRILGRIFKLFLWPWVTSFDLILTGIRKASEFLRGTKPAAGGARGGADTAIKQTAGDYAKDAILGGFFPAFLVSKAIGSAADGGITTQDGLMQIHKHEAIIPLDRFERVVERPAAATQPVAQRSGAPVNVSLSIPVKVQLNELVLGEAIVTVTEEMLRREFGSRGIRLAGIG